MQDQPRLLTSFYRFASALNDRKKTRVEVGPKDVFRMSRLSLKISLSRFCDLVCLLGMYRESISFYTVTKELYTFTLIYSIRLPSDVPVLQMRRFKATARVAAGVAHKRTFIAKSHKC